MGVSDHGDGVSNKGYPVWKLGGSFPLKRDLGPLVK